MPVWRRNHSKPEGRESSTSRSTRHNGGLEVASVRLAEQLMRVQPDRQEILYACRAGMPVDVRCIEVGIPTVPFMLRNSGDLAGVARLIRIVQEHDIDIIHVHSRRDYVPAVLAKAKLAKISPGHGPKLILHSHLQRPLGFPNWLCGYLFAPNVDRILAVSQTVRRFLLHTHRQLKPVQVVVVPNSVDVDRFAFSREARERIRAEYGYSESDFVIGMLGRLDAKGQDIAIKILAKIRRPNLKLMFVGESSKNGYDKKLDRLINHLNMSKQVIRVGMQSDIPAYLSAMDMLLHLPIDEAFGLALVEAMSCGLPVMSSHIGGCIEIVEDGATGVLVNPANGKLVQSKLTAFVDSPDDRNRYAEAGKTFVRTTFTIDQQIALLSDVYDEVYKSTDLERGTGKATSPVPIADQTENPSGDLCDALHETH